MGSPLGSRALPAQVGGCDYSTSNAFLSVELAFIPVRQLFI